MENNAYRFISRNDQIFDYIEGLLFFLGAAIWRKLKEKKSSGSIEDWIGISNTAEEAEVRDQKRKI
jgi:hypothetical protein